MKPGDLPNVNQWPCSNPKCNVKFKMVMGYSDGGRDYCSLECAESHDIVIKESRKMIEDNKCNRCDSGTIQHTSFMNEDRVSVTHVYGCNRCDNGWSKVENPPHEVQKELKEDEKPGTKSFSDHGSSSNSKVRFLEPGGDGKPTEDLG